MGDKTHIVELIDQMLDETSEQPQLQEKVLDLRDALFQAQQMAEQYSLKIKTLEEAIEKLKSPAHRIGTEETPAKCYYPFQSRLVTSDCRQQKLLWSAKSC